MVRQQTGLEHSTYDILEEPALPSAVLENTKILTHLLEPCSKREVSEAVKTKCDKTIVPYSREDFVFTFTDGSSDETLNNGGADVNFTFPQSGSTKHFKFSGSKIASNYTCELIGLPSIKPKKSI